MRRRSKLVKLIVEKDRVTRIRTVLFKIFWRGRVLIFKEDQLRRLQYDLEEALEKLARFNRKAQNDLKRRSANDREDPDLRTGGPTTGEPL